MAVGVGARRARVWFQRRGAAGDDGYGNYEGGWVNLTKTAVWGRLRPLPGREEVLAQRLAGVGVFEFTTPSSAILRTVDAACRALNARSGVAYDIKDIRNPDEQDRDLVFTLTSGGTSG